MEKVVEAGIICILPLSKRCALPACSYGNTSCRRRQTTSPIYANRAPPPGKQRSATQGTMRSAVRFNHARGRGQASVTRRCACLWRHGNKPRRPALPIPLAPRELLPRCVPPRRRCPGARNNAPPWRPPIKAPSSDDATPQLVHQKASSLHQLAS